MSQNISGNHAASWWQKLAADFPLFCWSHSGQIIRKLNVPSLGQSCSPIS